MKNAKEYMELLQKHPLFDGVDRSVIEYMLGSDECVFHPNSSSASQVYNTQPSHVKLFLSNETVCRFCGYEKVPLRWRMRTLSLCGIQICMVLARRTASPAVQTVSALRVCIAGLRCISALHTYPP